MMLAPIADVPRPFIDNTWPSQATSTPAHILEKTGVCIPMMEAAVLKIFHISCKHQYFSIYAKTGRSTTITFRIVSHHFAKIRPSRVFFWQAQAAPSEKGPNYVMLSPCAGLLPAGHGFQRGDWLLVTFPPTATPGISVTTRGDVSVEAEVVMITSPPGQGILVRMVGELGRNAGHVGVVDVWNWI